MRLKYFLLIICLVLFFEKCLAQETVNTRVVGVLALLPAKDPGTSRRLFGELINMGEEGLALVVAGVRPAGDLNGVPYRHGISLLTHYALSSTEKATVENAILKALSKPSDKEVMNFFIRNLEIVGSSISVPLLATEMLNPDLGEAAVSALQSIGTVEATERLRSGLRNAPVPTQIRITKALGVLEDKQSLPLFISMVDSNNMGLKKQSLWSIALLADLSASAVLLEQAKRAGFRYDSAESMVALVEYMERSMARGSALAPGVQTAILDHTLASDQQQFRLAALRNFVKTNPIESQQLLLKELNRFDDAYRCNVLNIARYGIQNENVFNRWVKQYKKSKGKMQAEILTMLAAGRGDDSFSEQYLLPGLVSKNADVRMVALQQLAATRNKKFTDPLVSFLSKATSEEEIREAQGAILQVADGSQIDGMAVKLSVAMPAVQVSIIQLLALRRNIGAFRKVAPLTASENLGVRDAAFKALPFLASPGDVEELVSLMASTNSESGIEQIQAALVATVNKDNASSVAKAFPSQKQKLLPVLAYINEVWSVDSVKYAFMHGPPSEKETAFRALCNWQSEEAISMLLLIRSDEKLLEFHPLAFQGFVRQVMASGWTDDQKLLRLRDFSKFAATRDEMKLVLRSAGGIRTFLSLVFVAEYLDDKELAATASRAAMRVALPTADAKPGLQGLEVRKVLKKVMSTLTGEDSQYDRIDVTTYLENMPLTIGFEPIFNGSDLSGWQGLVENPLTRAKMTKSVLDEKQKVADRKISESWTVKDGMICFSGAGANLCTIRSYADFEMILDWKISRNGDSGIYLRGTPQVQIWDISRVADGAQVGSGGLYNNSAIRNPLVVADNPIGEWNTMRITIIGERVTVYLNGLLTVDNVVMENYWDRKIPIFPEGAIELQAHGTELAFRNLFVRKLNQPYKLSQEEQEQGYEVLFNGKDLSSWVGNKTDYVVEDNCIAIYPADGGHGNLYTEKEFSDFIYRFEFQMTPAANNGLGIHAPLEGDAAYVGKELQILDDTNPAYANIQPYQAHGSVYGIVPAKRGFLKPVGEWNFEEVHVQGDQIKITLNGTVIVDADLKKASANGTMDRQNHPGLSRHKGHIGFLGHGSVLRFRNIRIKNLEK